VNIPLLHNVVDLTEREAAAFESVEQIALSFLEKPKAIFAFLLRFNLFGSPFPAFPHVALGFRETVTVTRFRDANAASFVDVMTVIGLS
jgi:hypothetical protein